MPFNTKLAAAGLIALTLATAASARPGWDRPGWGRPSASDWGNSRWDRPSASRNDDREGKVEAESFVADGSAADALGRGSVTIEIAGEGDPAYEAAVIDQLVRAGYDTLPAAEGQGQIAELKIVRSELVPPEGKRNPVSGEMDVGFSNRGSSVGLGINLDFSKPKKALVSTRLETRIRDRATGAVLWEGRADIATREGDDDWSDQAIATKLAQSLFRKFPGASDASYR